MAARDGGGDSKESRPLAEALAHEVRLGHMSSASPIDPHGDGGGPYSASFGSVG